MGEDVEYENYSWNLCRIPWRLAMDGAISTNPKTKEKNTAFESAFTAPFVTSLIGKMTFISSSGEGRYFSYKYSTAKAEISTQFSGCQEWDILEM